MCLSAGLPAMLNYGNFHMVCLMNY